jgi:hypothetical protein
MGAHVRSPPPAVQVSLPMLSSATPLDGQDAKEEAIDESSLEDLIDEEL